MSAFALLPLTTPEVVPVAAPQELLVVQAAFLEEAATADDHADLLTRLAAVAGTTASLLRSLVLGTASESESVAVTNAERLALAARRLFEQAAVAAEQRQRFKAMAWAGLCRRLYAATALVRKEHASTALLGVSWERAQVEALIRVLPGAELAITTLQQDPLVFAEAWDLAALSQALADWVRT